MTSTTIVALQNLYVALGGELETVANLVTIPDMINAIADLETAKASQTEETNEEEENEGGTE